MKKSFWILAFLVVGHPAFASFSDQAWKKIGSVYGAIVEHPFNRELAQGTLPQKTFQYYSDQDAAFLLDFAKGLALLATKLDDPSDVEKVMKLVAGSAEEARENREKNRALPRAAPATLLYTNYLLVTGFSKSKEELAAALLPCFWIYLKLADDLKRETKNNNPYLHWIDSYSSESYRKSVGVMLSLVDKLAASATEETRVKMFEAFTLASRLEWYFWDGAYRLEGWKP